MPGSVRKNKKKGVRSGKLRIADHWNAISIIANSQGNPLKAVAEFVENSIDAHAKQIVIVRGKKKGGFYLKISDDGEGQLTENHRESVTFIAPAEPCLTTLEVIVQQGDKTCRDEAFSCGIVFCGTSVSFG